MRRINNSNDIYHNCPSWSIIRRLMSISVIHLFFSKKKKICWTIVLELEWMKHVSLAAVLHYIIWVFNVFYWWHYFIWSINHITCWLWAYCRLFEKEQSFLLEKKKSYCQKSIYLLYIYRWPWLLGNIDNQTTGRRWVDPKSMFNVVILLVHQILLES